MTREEAIKWLNQIKDKYIHGGDEAFDNARKEALLMAIKDLDAITALGEELRTVRGALTRDALIGFNIALAICNKHLKEVKS